MLIGALAISTSTAEVKELTSTNQAIARECQRYGLDYDRVLANQTGIDAEEGYAARRRWWDYGIALIAISIFIWLAHGALRLPMQINMFWVMILLILMVLIFLAGTWWLWKKADFS